METGDANTLSLTLVKHSSTFVTSVDQMDNGNLETTFAKIKQLLRNDPFKPFTLRCGAADIEVTHPNAVAFHPEVPFLTIYDKTEIYDVPVEKISFVQRQHAL